MHNAIHGVISAEESTVKPTMDDKDQLQSTNPSKGMLYIVLHYENINIQSTLAYRWYNY